MQVKSFRDIITYMVNSFLASLEIPAMINILYKMIKTLHEKMLNTIYLYWVHNDTSEKNSSLNSYSNNPWINEERFVISPAKWNLLGQISCNRLSCYSWHISCISVAFHNITFHMLNYVYLWTFDFVHWKYLGIYKTRIYVA